MPPAALPRKNDDVAVKGPQVGSLAVLLIRPNAVRQVCSAELCQVTGLLAHVIRHFCINYHCL
jgi:hypothetical protein